MKLRSKLMPSRLDMKTTSLTPGVAARAMSLSGVRWGTKREGNIRYVPGALSYGVQALV